jgi:hypothetical protein
MPQNDYNAGRAAGVAEGHRKATLSRRWMDVVIMALIAASVVVITQTQQHGTNKLIRDANARTAATNQNAFSGCEQRNKIVQRQVQFYRDMALIEKGNKFIDDAIRKQRVDAYLDTANDITALGVRDCTVYLKIASSTPSPSPK